MTPQELKATFTMRSIEFEAAMEAGKPHQELLKIYKELKELQYQLIFAQLTTDKQKDVEIQ